MILDSSRLEVPKARSDRTIRSRETDGSPASILATRDWLDLTSLASSACFSRRFRRRSLRLCASRILSSMYAASSSESPRNSLVVPIRQPLASSFFRFPSRIVIFPEPSPAGFDYVFGRCPSFFAEDLQDYDGIWVSPIDKAPCRLAIFDPQLVASWSYGRHRPRVWHLEALASLKAAQ